MKENWPICLLGFGHTTSLESTGKKGMEESGGLLVSFQTALQGTCGRACAEHLDELRLSSCPKYHHDINMCF